MLLVLHGLSCALQRLRDASLLHIPRCVTVLESVDPRDTNLVDPARSARIMDVNIKYTPPTVVGINAPLTETMKIKIRCESLSMLDLCTCSSLKTLEVTCTCLNFVDMRDVVALAPVHTKSLTLNSIRVSINPDVGSIGVLCLSRVHISASVIEADVGCLIRTLDELLPVLTHINVSQTNSHQESGNPLRYVSRKIPCNRN